MKGTNPDQSIEARGRAAREPTILHAVVIAVLTSVLQCLLAMPLAVWCERQLRAGFDTGALGVLADADVILVAAAGTIFAVPLNYLLARSVQGRGERAVIHVAIALMWAGIAAGLYNGQG